MDTKKLRQKILDLAIHGKLVPQDPNDEPASVLLERIKAEKELLIKEGKIKRSKKTANASDTPHYENVPFEVPSSWVWTTLGEITSIIGDGLHGTPQYDPFGDYYFINGNNLSNRKIIIKKETKKVSESEYLKYQKPLNEFSILVSINGTIGNVGTYNNENVILGKSACYFNILSQLCKEYICYLIESENFLKYAIESATGSTIKNVPLKAMNEFLVPLPPYKEQKRIVTEIDYWTSLIEIIEQGKSDLQTAIKQAKNKILDLAIHGKLVPQDPNDEPASELLKRINPKAEITCDNGHYKNLPNGWGICSVNSVIHIVNGKSQKDVEEACGAYPIYGSGGVIGQANQYLCLSGSTIIGRKGTINSPIFAKENFWNVDTAFGMKPLEGISDLYFYYFCILFDFSSLDKSTALPSLTRKAIGNIELPVPPYNEQQRIVDAIDVAFKYLDTIMESL